jgi:hypothetical protein
MSINDLMKSFSNVGEQNNTWRLLKGFDILLDDERDYLFNIMIRITETYKKDWDDELKNLQDQQIRLEKEQSYLYQD